MHVPLYKWVRCLLKFSKSLAGVTQSFVYSGAGCVQCIHLYHALSYVYGVNRKRDVS